MAPATLSNADFSNANSAGADFSFGTVTQNRDVLPAPESQSIPSLADATPPNASLAMNQAGTVRAAETLLVDPPDINATGTDGGSGDSRSPANPSKKWWVVGAGRLTLLTALAAMFWLPSSESEEAANSDQQTPTQTASASPADSRITSVGANSPSTPETTSNDVNDLGMELPRNVSDAWAADGPERRTLGEGIPLGQLGQQIVSPPLDLDLAQGATLEFWVNGEQTSDVFVWGNPEGDIGNSFESRIAGLSGMVDRPRLSIGPSPFENGPDTFMNGRIYSARLSRGKRYTEHFEPAIELTADDATVVLYHLDNPDATRVPDLSGSGNDGRFHLSTVAPEEID